MLIHQYKLYSQSADVAGGAPHRPAGCILGASVAGVVFLYTQIDSLQHFVISTVIQLSDVHSSHICSAVLFPYNCLLLSHIFTDIAMGVRTLRT